MKQAPALDRSLLLLSAVALIAVLRLWFQPMFSPLWLDETAIVWTIGGGLGQITPRAFISLQSIAFCALEWVMAQFAGAAPFMLRLPSLAAGFGLVYVYNRIGIEVMDRELGRILAVILISVPAIAVQIPNARPYALALLASSLALLWLLRWVRSGRLAHGILWALCAVAAAHLHHLFAVALGLQAAIVVFESLRERRIRFRQVALCNALAAALLAPAVPQALVIRGFGRLLSFAAAPDPLSVLEALAPPILVFCVSGLAAIECAAGSRPKWIRPKTGGRAAVFACVLLGIPALLFLAMFRVSGINLFLDRYFLLGAPGLILLWGWLLRGLEPGSLRRMSLLVVLVASTVGGISGHYPYHQENWRVAADSIPDSGAVLIYSSLVETRRLEWLQSPERWPYLTAPVGIFRPDLSRARGFLIPFEFDSESRKYMQALLSGPLRSETKITLIVRNLLSSRAWLMWSSDQLSERGFGRTRQSTYGRVEVQVFERRAGAPM